MQELQKTIDAETSRREEAAARAATLEVTVGELTELVRNREQALDQKPAEVTKQPVVELSPQACEHLSTFLKSWHPNERRLLFATPTKIPSGGQSEWLQGHFVAQAFQPPDQGSAGSVHVDPVKVVRTEFPVVFLTLQHVIGNLQQRVCYRHDRALSSPPSSNAPIQRREVVVLHHRDGPGRLRQQRRSETLPLRILPLSRFPALSKLPGHKQAQEAKCPEDGNWFMSNPISASNPQAVTRSTPGMVHSRVTLSSKGRMRFSISCSISLRFDSVKRRCSKSCRSKNR